MLYVWSCLCFVCFFCNDNLIVLVEENTCDDTPLVDNGDVVE